MLGVIVALAGQSMLSGSTSTCHLRAASFCDSVVMMILSPRGRPHFGHPKVRVISGNFPSPPRSGVKVAHRCCHSGLRSANFILVALRTNGRVFPVFAQAGRTKPLPESL